MEINSLQDLIAKFKGNFNLLPTQQNAAAAAAAAAQPPVAPDPGKDLTSGDKVTLSAEALAYQKAHTLASGKFMNPNVLDDFMSALDGTDQSDDSSQDQSSGSLLDILTANSGSARSDSSSPIPQSSADLAAMLNKMKGFLG